MPDPRFTATKDGEERMRLRIVLTMDCEPTTASTHGSATGPSDWAFGERAVTGYASIARSYGWPVSYFVHPETAQAQPDLFLDQERGGAHLGLHVHPWKYSMSRHAGTRYLEHSGGLSDDEQRALLDETSAIWAEAFGRRPDHFRPGTFSANDATFRILAERGFVGGSCSLPGRQMPEMRANWTGADPDPHRAHPVFRQLAGSLDLAEMPVSVDFSRSLQGKVGGRFHPDLRPDIDWRRAFGLSYADIATAIVAQVLERRPAVPVLNLLTHNQFDYADPGDAACMRLREALDAVVAACEACGVEPVGATVGDVTAAVRSREAPAQPFVCEGNMYGREGPVGTLGAPRPA
jgi:hypothetical protein